MTRITVVSLLLTCLVACNQAPEAERTTVDRSAEDSPSTGRPVDEPAADTGGAADRATPEPLAELPRTASGLHTAAFLGLLALGAHLGVRAIRTGAH